MRANILAVVLIVACLAAPASAQVLDSFYVEGSLPNRPLNRVIYEVDETGRIQSTIVHLPRFWFVYRMTQDEHNQSIRVLGDIPGSPPTPTLFDISVQGKITTLHAGWPLGRGLTLDPAPDGYGWLIAQRAWLTGDPFQTARYYNGRVSSLAVSPGLIAYGAGFNQETGRVMVRAQQVQRSSIGNGYFEVDQATGKYATIAQIKSGQGWINEGLRHLLYEGHNSTYVDVMKTNYQGSAVIHRVVTSSGAFPFPRQGAVGAGFDLIASGREARGHQYDLYHRSCAPPYRVGLTRLAADGTRLGHVVFPGVVGGGNDLVRKGGRALCWITDTAPNNRSLHLSFPRHAGKDYVAAFSISGVRPNPALGDGRRIPLLFDDVTRLCLQGGIPGVLRDPVGRLDPTGRARVTLAFNPYAVKGLKVWAAAVVLDPKAPHGVARIAGPILAVMQ